MLGEPVETGLWLTRIPDRWYHHISSGTELDLVFVVLALPFIACRSLLNAGKPKIERGPVFCALTENQVVFFLATEGIFRRGLKREYDRRNIEDVVSCTFRPANRKQFRIDFSDGTKTLLCYSGPHLELEAFISKVS